MRTIIKKNRDLIKLQRENRITSINGMPIEKYKLSSLELSNKHCYIETYTSAEGYRAMFLSAPYIVEFEPFKIKML